MFVVDSLKILQIELLFAPLFLFKQRREINSRVKTKVCLEHKYCLFKLARLPPCCSALSGGGRAVAISAASPDLRQREICILIWKQIWDRKINIPLGVYFVLIDPGGTENNNSINVGEITQ